MTHCQFCHNKFVSVPDPLLSDTCDSCIAKIREALGGPEPDFSPENIAKITYVPFEFVIL